MRFTSCLTEYRLAFCFAFIGILLRIIQYNGGVVVMNKSHFVHEGRICGGTFGIVAILTTFIIRGLDPQNMSTSPVI